jgi:hypothetical protein
MHISISILRFKQQQAKVFTFDLRSPSQVVASFRFWVKQIQQNINKAGFQFGPIWLFQSHIKTVIANQILAGHPVGDTQPSDN